MILKEEQRGRLFRCLASFFRPSKVKTSPIFLLVLAILIFLSGALTYRFFVRNRTFDDVIKPALKVGFLVPSNYLHGLFSDPEKITIDIKFENWQKIVQARNDALEKGLIDDLEQIEVPAILTHNGKKMSIKIRLKGDRTDHLWGEKWSFRIKMRDNDSFLGMTRFSIHTPARREYIFEWLFDEFLKKEGLASLDYDFIDVTLNGKRLGIYAIEEFFSERTLVNNKLPVGPILKINDDHYLSLAHAGQSIERPKDEPAGMIYASAPIEVFESSKWTSPDLKEEYAIFQTAKDLLESFRRGRLRASEVFDAQKTAKFFAIMDLTSAFHASTWPNMRLYYNPLTSHLEFIGYDAASEVGVPLSYLSGYPRSKQHLESSVDDLRYDIFQDPIIYEEYIKQLERISRSSYLDDFFAGIKESLNEKLHIIYRDEPYYFFDKNWLYENSAYIEKVLHPGVGARVYFKDYNEKTNTIVVQVGNIQPLPVEVLNVYSGERIFFEPLSAFEILAGRNSNTPIDFKNFEFSLPRDFNWSDDVIQSLFLEYKIPGASITMSEKIIPWPLIEDAEEIERIKNRQKSNVNLFDFLIVDNTNKIIFVKKGKWTLEKDLVVPSDFTFVAGAGSEIDLVNSSRIISHSPLRFTGNDDSLVKITSSDKTSKGIWIYAPQKSYLENVVIVNNLVNFYESPSALNKAYFVGSSSYDDSLHITRSDFELVDSYFSNVLSDAVDIDYGKGIILRTSFDNSGNDAIDFSGSVVTIKDINIKNAGDKGVSVGEDSRIEAENLTIIDSNIGLASKDLSELNALSVIVENCKVGVALFQKKPEFGPAKAVISGLKIKKTKEEFLVEQGSFLEIDGRAVEDKEISLKERLY